MAQTSKEQENVQWPIPYAYDLTDKYAHADATLKVRKRDIEYLEKKLGTLSDQEKADLMQGKRIDRQITQ